MSNILVDIKILYDLFKNLKQPEKPIEINLKPFLKAL